MIKHRKHLWQQLFCCLLAFSLFLMLSPLPTALAEPTPTPQASPMPTPEASAEPTVTPGATPPPMGDEADEPVEEDPLSKRPMMIALLSVGLILSASLLLRFVAMPSFRRKKRSRGTLMERPLRKPSSHRDDLELYDYYHSSKNPLDQRRPAPRGSSQRRGRDARIRTRGSAGTLTNAAAPQKNRRTPVTTKAEAMKKQNTYGSGGNQQRIFERPTSKHTGAAAFTRSDRSGFAPANQKGARAAKPEYSKNAAERGRVTKFPSGGKANPKNNKRRP